MATFEEVKEPYEILFRFGKGKPQGGHVQYIERLIVNGVVRSEKICDAEPLDLEGFPTSAIMSDTTRDAVAEVQRLQAELETAKAEASAAAQSAEKTISELDQSLATATQQKMNHAALAANAEKAHSEAASRIAELEVALAAKPGKRARA